MRYNRIIALLLALCLCLCGAAMAESGEYAPDGFRFSGGSGKVEISCPALWRVGDADWARLVFSSANYPRLVSEGVEYTATHDGKTSIF